MAIKMYAWAFGYFVFEPVEPYVFLNMACLTIAIAIGLYFIKIKNRGESNLLLDIKNAMGVGMIYSLLIVGFLYVFYSHIHPNYVIHRQNVEKAKYDESYELAGYRKQYEQYKNKSDKEISASEDQKVDIILNSRNLSLISLLGMTVLSMFNSIFIAIIYRRVLFRST